MQQSIDYAKVCCNAGIDYLHPSHGIDGHDLDTIELNDIPPNFPYSSQIFAAWKIKEQVDIPVIATGQIKTADGAETLLKSGYGDFVGIGCSYLADPQWGTHALNGQSVTKCYKCKLCFWFTDYTKCPAYRFLHENK